MQIEYRDIENLIPYARNARTHSDEQIQQIAASIKEFGFNDPVAVDGESGIIEGHGRVLAARKLGHESIPVIELSHLSDVQKRAYILAHNKLTENAGWDQELLAVEMSELQAAGIEDLTGFASDEIDALLTESTPEGNTDEDAVPEEPEEPVTQKGDVWICGKHRVKCGDATSADDVGALLNGISPDLVHTDPPYGMNAVSNSGVLSKSYGSDISNDENSDVAKKSFALIYSLLPNAKHIWWGANYYASALPDSECWLVWDKNNGESDQADCELAWANFRSVVRQFTKASEKTNRKHPNQKPVSLMEWIIKRFRLSSYSIADFFGGSGSTLIAAEKHGVMGYVMELDPLYCDVIVKRWQDYTGKQAIHETTGKAFDEVNNG